MKTLLLTFLLLVGLSLPALGLYLQPEIKEIPVDRLISNLAKMAEADPASAKIQHQLARSHAMAYARKLGEGEKVRVGGKLK